MFSYIFDHSYWLQAFCLLSAWLLLILFTANVFSALMEILQQSQKMHQIPCHSCQYFTNSYHLKCTIHPAIANTELAINCRDFQP